MEDIKAGHYFYKNKKPEMNELVMVHIDNVDDMGVKCSLIEYNNLEGFMSFAELLRKSIKSVSKHVRVGQKHILQVINIENNYINLSKKYIDEDEKNRGLEKYRMGKTVNGIVNHMAELKHVEPTYVYELMIWPLYDKYDHPYYAFEQYINNNLEIYDDMVIPTDYKDSIFNIVKNKFKLQLIKVGAEFDITCYTGGIQCIKKSLTAGLISNESSYDIKIQLVSSPTFCIFTTSYSEIEAATAISAVLSVIEIEILKVGGTISNIKPSHVL